MNSPAQGAEHADRDTGRARRGLGIFLVLVVAGSAPLLYLIVGSGSPIRELPQYVLPLMWMPAIASVGTRLVTGEGFADLSFKLRERRILLVVGLAIGFPIAVGLIAYGIAWGSGIVSFTPPAETASPILAFVSQLIFAGTLGAAVGVISAAGEEIGWRGYMIPRMVEGDIPAPFLVGGILWGLWHAPAILTGQYAAGSNRLLSAGLFIVLAVALTVLWSIWTLETGSIWPAIVGHAAWNAIIQGPFDMFSSGQLSTTLVGESGILVIVTSILIVILLVSRRLPNGVSAAAGFSYRPDEPPTASTARRD